MAKELVPRNSSLPAVIRANQIETKLPADVESTLAFVRLDDIALSLEEIVDSLKKKEFKGELDQRPLSATDQLQYIDLVRNSPYTPWIRAFFINRGPINPAYIAINDPLDDKWRRLGVGESSSVDMAMGDKRIEQVYYKCDAGLTARIEAEGKY